MIENTLCWGAWGEVGTWTLQVVVRAYLQLLWHSKDFECLVSVPPAFLESFPWLVKLFEGIFHIISVLIFFPTAIFISGNLTACDETA